MGNDLKYGLVLGVVVLLIFVGYMTMKTRASKPAEPEVATSTSTTPAPVAEPFNIMAPLAESTGALAPAPGVGTGTQVATAPAPAATFEISRPAVPPSYGAPATAATTAKPAMGGSSITPRTGGAGFPASTSTLAGRDVASGPTGVNSLTGTARPSSSMTTSLPIVTSMGEPAGTRADNIKDLGLGGTSDKSYTIAKGDTLAAISKKFYGTADKWQKIADANKGLSATNLQVGQKITIPDAGTSATATKADTSTATALMASTSEKSAGGKTYTVAKGDTLMAISRKFYGTGDKWQKILDANKGVSAKNLKVGQKLLIP